MPSAQFPISRGHRRFARSSISNSQGQARRVFAVVRLPRIILHACVNRSSGAHEVMRRRRGAFTRRVTSPKPPTRIVDFPAGFTLYRRAVDRSLADPRAPALSRTSARRGLEAKRTGCPFLKTRAASQGGMDDEENLSTEPTGPQAPPRIPLPHGDQERTQGARPPPRQGAQAPVGVTGRDPMIERLKKRRDFLAAAKGSKAARRAFVLEARRARGRRTRRAFGFTVSKRVGEEGGGAEPHPPAPQGSRAARRSGERAARARLCAGRTPQPH